MVLSFFRRGESPLDHIEQQIGAMLGDCRHSFDRAMTALITDADIGPIGDEVRATDRRINQTEETVRRELVVHVSVHGGTDVGLVLTSLLIVKKLERVGDQAKNIFDLAAEGVRFSGADDYDQFIDLHNEVSSMMGEAATTLAAADQSAADALIARCEARMRDLDGRVNELIHSDYPAHHAVPRAMLFRYIKRIVANVAGVVGTLVRPLDRSNLNRGDLDE
jgi:phosphate uptake regulator